jgi:ABC-2 type transport system ATP-binding protein
MELKIDHLSKEYGQQKAVDDLSFTANTGEILGFLGPNGAGKSTTMKMIMGYLKPNYGSITIDGKSIDQDEEWYKTQMGYLSESNPLYRDLYVKEYLNFVADIHRLPNKKQRVDELISLTGLGIEKSKKIKMLSKGYKQRVGLAQALIHDPKILILDEPTSGLDLNQIVEIRSLIKSFQKDKMIIFSSHIMQEVEALCSRVIIINKGKLIADDPIDKLSHRIKGTASVAVEFIGQTPNLQVLNSIDGVKAKVGDRKNTIIFEHNGKKEIRPDIFDLCVKSGIKIIEMKQDRVAVEQVFQSLTSENN